MDRVTAVLCTRNRGAALRGALRSVLASNHPAFRVVVVDQSTNDDSEASIEDLKPDGRLDYVRSRTVGLSAARNVGVARADTEIVVFTDDDCEVPPDWLGAMQAVMAADPRIAVTFCSVRAGPHDPSAGFLPACEFQGTRVVRGIEGLRPARGMGAGLAVRRSAVEALHGFDEELGPGARFASCDDRDFAIRALLAGFEVCETDRTHVIHHGFRSWPEVKELGRRDWTAIGAAYCKPLRAGHWRFARSALYELGRAVGQPLDDLVHLRRPRGMAWSVHLLRGFWRGWAAPFDRERLLFKPPPG